MSKKKQQKQLMDFLQALIELSEVEVIGIAKVLKVPLVVGKDDGVKMPRPAESILSDILDKFIVMDKVKKTNLLKIVSAAAQNNREDNKKSYLGKNDRGGRSESAAGGNDDADSNAAQPT